MNTLTLKLEEIWAGDRLREVDADWAEVIAGSIAEHGMMTPIEVRATPDKVQLYALVAGAHRFRAVEMLGWTEVTVTVFDGDAIAARLREIEENLIRHELTVLDKASFVAEQKSLYEALHPVTKQGKNNRFSQGRQVGDLGAERFTKVAADRVGLGERTLQRLAKLHSALNPALRGRLTGTWLANNGQQLGQLAHLPKDKQIPVVELLFGEVDEATRPKTVLDAVARVLNDVAGPRDADQEMANRIMGLWRKASAKTRRIVAPQIHSDIEKILRRDKP